MKEGIAANIVERQGLSDHTVFDKLTHIEHPELLRPPLSPLVSTRRKRAGKALVGAIAQAGAPMGAVALSLHVPSAALTSFHDGKASLDPSDAYTVASRFVYEEIPEMKELQAICAEERLMRTLTRSHISIGRSIHFLRLNALQNRKDFAAKAQLSETHLGQLEQGRREPNISTVNQAILASGLDTSGMPAQVIRLMVEHTDPMSLAKLKTCNYGELFKYLRQLKGFPQAVLARKMKDEQSGMDQSTVKDIEKGRIIRPKKVETFIKALELDPKSTLADVIRSKAHTPKKEIPDEDIYTVFSGDRDGQFLFAENLEEVGSDDEQGSIVLLKSLTTARRQLMEAGETKTIIGTLLLKLRNSIGLSQGKVVAGTERVTKADLWRIEKGEQIPLDVTVAKLLNAMGYDMQSLVAWFFIDTLNLVSSDIT